MSIEIQVRRVEFEGYILEFVVSTPDTVRVKLLTHKDPTLVDTQFITVAWKDFYREAPDARDMESFDVFAERMYSETQAWARAAIKDNEATKALAKALGAVLPPGIEA